MALSMKGIEKLRKVPGRYRDDGEGGVQGLYLTVPHRKGKAADKDAAGGASWLLRYEVQIPAVPGARTWLERHGRRERWMGLGSFADFGLKEARERARAKRQLLADGTDPLAQKKADKLAKALQAAKTLTFKEAAQQYIAQNEKKWRSQKHAAQWSSTLAEYAYPVIGALAVADVDVGMVLRVLEQPHNGDTLWNAIPETASRLRGRIESILGWAKVRDPTLFHGRDNPASWKNHLSNVLPPRGKKVHHPALPYTRIGEFMAALREREGQVVRALEFTILTAARTGETTGARWAEIDLAAKLWTVPAGRIKGGVEHKVPLSSRAVAILQQLPHEEGNELVFIGGTQPGQGLVSNAMDQLSKKMAYASTTPGKLATVHGMRSAFKDWAVETTSFPNDMSEIALSHKVGDATEAAYRRGAMLVKRMRMMEAWAMYCGTLRQDAQVIPMQCTIAKVAAE